MLLLIPVRNLPLLLLLFLPVLSVTCSFISETVLIALLMPLFLVTLPLAHVGAMWRQKDAMREHVLNALEWAADNPR